MKKRGKPSLYDRLMANPDFRKRVEREREAIKAESKEQE